MNTNNTWEAFFIRQKETMYFSNLIKFIDAAYNETVYPPIDQVFAVFKLTPLDNVKVVILGQDPYHKKGQAQGLSFSVPKDVKLPPSLVNIFKEIEGDLKEKRVNGDLCDLALQGVLLLNTILTVKEGQPLSHNIPEYKQFVIEVFKELAKSNNSIVYLLWGTNARGFKKYIGGRHLILEANHPSPLSANRGGFFGCKHFSKTNEYLVKNGQKPIEWTSQAK